MKAVGKGRAISVDNRDRTEDNHQHYKQTQQLDGNDTIENMKQQFIHSTGLDDQNTE